MANSKVEGIRKLLSSLGGRRFVLIVLTLIVTVARSKFQIDIPDDVLQKVADLVMVFVGAESMVDVMSVYKTKK